VYVDLYRDRPDLYDLLHDEQTADLVFYGGLAQALVPPGGSALELGCGSGRVMETLLREGLEVTGVDAEEPMLDRARERLTRFGVLARLVQGDMRRLEALPLRPEGYDLIVCAVNTFMHLEDHAAQTACLASIRACLAPDGTAVLDLANPFHAITLPQGTLTLRRHAYDVVKGREVSVTGVLEVDPTAPRVVDRLFFDEWGTDTGGAVRRSSSRVELRLVFMPELELLLSAVGLGITDAYGDYELGPYHATAERMIVVLRPYDA